MWRSYYWDNFSFWPFGSFLNILYLALIICAIVYLAKNSSKNQSIPPKKQDEAMDILRKRYASGEISAEEFTQKKKDLEA